MLISFFTRGPNVANVLCCLALPCCCCILTNRRKPMDRRLVHQVASRILWQNPAERLEGQRSSHLLLAAVSHIKAASSPWRPDVILFPNHYRAAGRTTKQCCSGIHADSDPGLTPPRSGMRRSYLDILPCSFVQEKKTETRESCARHMCLLIGGEIISPESLSA